MNITVKRFLQTLVVVGLAVGLVLVWLGVRDPAWHETGAAAPPDLVRGEYLTRAGDCVACHTAQGGVPFAGGLSLNTPFGIFYSPNITADPQYGIGAWSSDDFYRALHNGKGLGGKLLYPVFPFTNYTNVTRADSDAIYGYLRSLPVAHVPNQAHKLTFPFNQRIMLVGWRALFFRAKEYAPDIAQSEKWNRGAYLANGLGHCNACHSPRNILGATRAHDDYGGALVPVTNWYAPELTSNRESGLGTWSDAEVSHFLKTGVSTRGGVYGPMAEVVGDSLQYLSDDDTEALATYLKSLGKPGSHPTPPPPLPSDTRVMQAGAQIYKDNCSTCHGDQGQGNAPAYPPLANNQSVETPSVTNAVRMVLNGGFPPSTTANPRPYGMPPFGQALTDAQIADVVTYIRQSWGNTGHPVGPTDIEAARGAPSD